jgi:hypothetical protein
MPVFISKCSQPLTLRTHVLYIAVVLDGWPSAELERIATDLVRTPDEIDTLNIAIEEFRGSPREGSSPVVIGEQLWWRVRLRREDIRRRAESRGPGIESSGDVAVPAPSGRSSVRVALTSDTNRQVAAGYGGSPRPVLLLAEYIP